MKYKLNKQYMTLVPTKIQTVKKITLKLNIPEQNSLPQLMARIQATALK